MRPKLRTRHRLSALWVATHRTAALVRRPEHVPDAKSCSGNYDSSSLVATGCLYDERSPTRFADAQALPPPLAIRFVAFSVVTPGLSTPESATLQDILVAWLIFDAFSWHSRYQQQLKLWEHTVHLMGGCSRQLSQAAPDCPRPHGTRPAIGINMSVESANLSEAAVGSRRILGLHVSSVHGLRLLTSPARRSCDATVHATFSRS